MCTQGKYFPPKNSHMKRNIVVNDMECLTTTKRLNIFNVTYYPAWQNLLLLITHFSEK